MRSVESLLAEYDKSHAHRVNKILHWICVPLIVFSLLGLLSLIKLPVRPVNLSAADALVILAMIYYVTRSRSLALGMLLVSGILLSILFWMESAALPTGWICLAIFIASWIGQFIGHGIEGKRPSFFKDIQFLLIGPLWLLSFIYRKLRITY